MEQLAVLEQKPGMADAAPANTQINRRRRRTKQAILDAALKIFLNDGFDQASMDDIAIMASVSKRTIYNLYASKDALFNDVATQACHNLLSLDYNVSSASDLKTCLEELGAAILKVTTRRQAVSLARLIAFYGERMPDLAETYWRCGYQRQFRLIEEAFDRFADEHSISGEDRSRAVWTFLSALRGPVEVSQMMGQPTYQPVQALVGTLPAQAARSFFCLFGKADA